MRVLALWFGAAAFWLAGPISAARADYVDTCVNGAGDEKIAACTTAINSGRWHGSELAWAYNDRGNGYQDRGDYDRALADYNDAIRLDPKDSIAYNGRGNAYRNKGAPERAIADYLEAIRLDPKYATPHNGLGNAYVDKSDLDTAIAEYTVAVRLSPKYALAYFNRGVTNLYAGSQPNALADLNQASALNPKYAYAALWLDIVGQRGNLPSRLSEAIAAIDMSKWPAPVVRMFMGQMTAAAVLAAADDPNAATKKGQVCEANFYSGELALRRNEKGEAARLFRLAAADCPISFTELFAANAELKALGAP